MSKQTIYYIAFLLFFSTAIYSQDKIKIGVNTGITYSSWRGNVIVENYESEFSFLTGGYFEYYIKENVSLKSNLNFERKSFNAGERNFVNEFGEFLGTSSITINLDYLSLPIMIKYDLGKRQNFFVNGGIFMGYLLSEKSKAKGIVNSTDDLEQLKKLDIGLTLGVGTSISLGEKSKLLIELRENLGILNTAKGMVINDGATRTNSFNLILGWAINI